MQESALSGTLPVVHREAEPRPRTWRYIGVAAHLLTTTAAMLFLIGSLFAGAEPIFMGIVTTVLTLTVASAIALGTGGRWAQWLSGVVGLALSLLLAQGLVHAAFDSFFDFAPVVIGVLGGVLAVGGAAAELTRRPEPGEAFRGGLVLVGGGGMALLVAVMAVSGVVTITGKSTLTDAERAGSVPVAMKDFKFAPETLTVTAGSDVSIALKNSDPVIHDLAVKSLDLKFSVKPGSEKLFTFTAPEAGEYKIVCSLHGGMDGKLVVTAP